MRPAHDAIHLIPGGFVTKDRETAWKLQQLLEKMGKKYQILITSDPYWIKITIPGLWPRTVVSDPQLFEKLLEIDKEIWIGFERLNHAHPSRKV